MLNNIHVNKENITDLYLVTKSAGNYKQQQKYYYGD